MPEFTIIYGLTFLRFTVGWNAATEVEVQQLWITIDVPVASTSLNSSLKW